MSVPTHVRNDVKEKLWAEADRLSWSSLSANDKARYYTIWTETADLGGKLSAYMDPRHVRVYIKDTLLKPYTRETSANPAVAYRVLGISTETQSIASYIKPHGRLLSDSRQIAWSKASEWKGALMALHERSFERGRPFGVVLMEAGAKFSMERERSMVESAAKKLGIERVVWLD